MKRLALLLASVAALRGQPPSFEQTTASVGCTPVDEFSFVANGFGQPVQPPPGTNVVVGDFNGDKKPDLAFLCSGQISILLGNGDGTFEQPILTSIPVAGNSLIAADLNTDGKTDLIIGDASSREMLVLVSMGDGKFQAPAVYESIAGAQNVIVVGDFTGGGKPDVLFANDSYTSVFASTLFLLMTGKGDGTFLTPIEIATPNYIGITEPYNIAAADFLSNGSLGFTGVLLESNDSGPFGGVPLFLGEGGGKFDAGSNFIYSASNWNLDVFVGDFNGDGKPDLALAPLSVSGPGFVYGLLGAGDGTFQSPLASTVLFGGFYAVGDVDGDGKSDLVEVAGTHGVSILISKGTGAFTVSSLPTTGTNPSGVAIADLNGDGKLDIVTANSGSGDGTILLNSVSSATVTAAVNGASFASAQPVSVGSIATLFGTDFVTTESVASAIPLPVSLGNVSVTIGGIPAPLFGVYKNQINLQVPWTVPAGSADVIVTVNGTALSSLKMTVASIAPAIFTTQSGVGQAVAINPDNSIADSQHPAKAGEALVILATGLGPVTPADGNGVASLDAERKAVSQPTVLIDGVEAPVSFAGLSPQFVGVNQINVVVPKVATPGTVPLQIKSGGVETSNQVTISVAN